MNFEHRFTLIELFPEDHKCIRMHNNNQNKYSSPDRNSREGDTVEGIGKPLRAVHEYLHLKT